METLKARFRIVTPMFISGADQTKAELRVPSIKGALRFWWRALSFERCGGDLKRLCSNEAQLFGSSDKGIGQSKVLMRLNEQRLSFEVQQKWPPNTWEGYVGYGLIESTGGDHRQFIKPGSTFLLELALTRSLSKKEVNSLHDAIITLGLIGGLGGRSRKGWGSVVLERLEGLAVDWAAPSNEDDLRRELNRLLGSGERRDPVFTAVSSTAAYELGPVQRSACDAHRFLAETYRTVVREEQNKSHREQLGLPRKNAGKNEHARRASPVFLHVHEFSRGDAVPVTAYLPGKFLEGQNIPAGGSTLVQRLLRSLPGNQ
jgi:CRISPR-associated protein Cmr1